MTTLRWPDGRGRFVDRDTDRTPDDVDILSIGPGATVEVDDQETVDHYLARGFEAVDDGDSDGSDTDGDGFDADAFVDRTPVSDVADDIAAGDADGHLDAVAAADDRKTVQDAVEERRAETGE